MLPAGTRPVVGVARQRLQTGAQGPRGGGRPSWLAGRVPGGSWEGRAGLGPLSTPLR